MELKRRTYPNSQNMRNNIRKLFPILLIAFIPFGYFAQLSIDAQIRPRSEFRNGFNTPALKDSASAFFTNQRTRLTFNHKTKFLESRVSIQDIRVWGSTSQLNSSDNYLAIHEAWGKVIINSTSDLKVGRQEIKYDNERIFGNVGWAQQGRKHDALLYNMSGKFTLNIGVAFNQVSEALSGTYYSIPNNYKSLQFIRFAQSREKYNFSLYAVNVGNQADTSANLNNHEQTLGGYSQFRPLESISITAEGYYQMGKTKSFERKEAFFASLEIAKYLKDKYCFTLGSTILSGTSANSSSNGSFDPLFGTHHKFYGHMDYFYVGNSHGQNGLIDSYIGFSAFKKSCNNAHFHLIPNN